MSDHEQAKRERIAKGRAITRDTVCCLEFAAAMMEKMKEVRDRRPNAGTDWTDPSWADGLRESIRAHVEKGDPLDVGIYAMMAWVHGWSLTEGGQEPSKREGRVIT